jgi:peptidyl-prolyl cis-trans isomerase SurA
VGLRKNGFSAQLVRYVPVALGVAIATASAAQESAPDVNSTATLKLPENPQLFGTSLPSVVKATAIVNGEVITQTDIDQRVALLAIANGGSIPAD